VAHRPQSLGTSTPGGLTATDVGQLEHIAALLDAGGRYSTCSPDSTPRSLPLSLAARELMKSTNRLQTFDTSCRKSTGTPDDHVPTFVAFFGDLASGAIRSENREAPKLAGADAIKVRNSSLFATCAIRSKSARSGAASRDSMVTSSMKLLKRSPMRAFSGLSRCLALSSMIARSCSRTLVNSSCDQEELASTFETTQNRFPSGSSNTT
jgi:hypothetical protein